ncbi:MAG: aspartate carbamoyltransferase catalytic subunit [Deltaproteobacteria bacterium]|jgi:aspartate carbamoyltransferase catalytic subunit|nr:aspartate carbamoyltransferase catalytic subunit [Deltaproteobacteria bacterium]
MENFPWPHKDLLDVDGLSIAESQHLLDTAEQFQEINSRAVKKVPALRGKGVILFFAENSTRTKTSFDIAAKRLSADTFSLGKNDSSLTKGESLKDTALTLQAMSPDIIVIRHALSGAASFLSDKVDSSIVNAGDGWHAHPTQALLDAYTLRKYWRDKNQTMQGKSLLIVGDVAHSRVARSNIKLMTALGLQVRIFAPKTLLPKGAEHWPVQIFDSLDKAVRDADAVMCLRLQLERQAAGLLPHLSEYAEKFCLTRRLMDLAAPGAPVLHPGPMNRGLEVADDLADSSASLVLDQVSAGVAVRMAVLFLLGTRKSGAFPA